MHTTDLAPLFDLLLRELAEGSPDPSAHTYVLNQGDRGLLASLDAIDAVAASATRDGTSIAAHTDHLRYGLMLLNRWAGGSPPPWPDMDWTASWKRNVVSEAEWQELRAALRREVTAWRATIGTPREVREVEARWMAGSVAHFAYHMGAIRQLDRRTRGPSAESEADAMRRASEPS